MITRKAQQQEPQPMVCSCRIALTDVARALVEAGVVSSFSSGRVSTTAADMGLDTGPDWAGRPSVTAQDAAALRAELLRRRDANLAAQTQAARARDEAMRAGRAGMLSGTRVITPPSPPA